MKSVVRWAVHSAPAMNTLLLAGLIFGLFCGFTLRREEFPRFQLEIVLVTVPYPGASPDEVESGICEKIEESVRSIDGIKKITSIAGEGAGNVIIELKSDTSSAEAQRILGEVESEIDRIPSFPDLAEEPEIRQLTMRNPAIQIGVVGPESASADAELKLREITERVRDDLLLIPQITVADIQGERPYQIDVEISEETLRKYRLTLAEVANRIRRENIELPGGTLRGNSQEYLLRGKNKKLTGDEIAAIPLVSKSNGVALTVGDLGTVKDEFVDTTSISRINGLPGLAVSVEAADGEDLIAMTKAVRDYVKTTELEDGYEFALWQDSSINVKDRLDLLKRNGLQGLVLVFLVLGLFLELRLAFWVALGIPVSVLGACAVLWQFDQTLNMLSMFAFLIALGIVVDDAIVIGENIYAHREQGKKYLQAAIDGTVEVLPSVTTSVTTTVFAFMPMFFVSGVMGKFFAVMPLAVIAMLIISLFESALILPCHLAHESKKTSYTRRALQWCFARKSLAGRFVFGPVVVVFALPIDLVRIGYEPIEKGFGWVNGKFARFLQWFIERVYARMLRFSIAQPIVTISIAFAALIFSFGLVKGGVVPWSIFPKMDARVIEAKVVFPDGTPSHITDKAAQRIEAAILRIDERYKLKGTPLIDLAFRMVGQVASQSPGGASDRTDGSHAATVKIELVENSQRELTSQQIVDLWRKETGSITGAETLSFGSVSMGPGGRAIEFKLLSEPGEMVQLEAAVEQCKAKLATYKGIYDISDDSRPGKWEVQLQVKDDAQSLGIPLNTIAGAVRGAYYGEEVMRLQRGRHEVKLMVRYPESERKSLSDLEDLRIDAGDGIQRPISSIAKMNVARGFSEINRVDQKRSITISADIDEAVTTSRTIVEDMKAEFLPELFKQYKTIQVRWEGEAEQSQESMMSLFIGMALALAATYVLLTLEFNSYIQPVIVMAVIPFGTIGALWGHALMHLPLTLFSVMGMVALTGIVVNDSIVLVDFINSRIKAGISVEQAVLESGQRRFRPVVLTSLTTVAGLLPLLMEKSLQAQFLIPMANSICFGLMLATLLVLFLVPTFFLISSNFTAKSKDDELVDDTDVHRSEAFDKLMEKVNGNGSSNPQPTIEPAVTGS